MLQDGTVNFDSNSCQIRKFAAVDFDSSQRFGVTLVAAPNTLSVTVSDPHPSTVTLGIVVRNAWSRVCCQSEIESVGVPFHRRPDGGNLTDARLESRLGLLAGRKKVWGISGKVDSPASRLILGVESKPLNSRWDGQ